MGQQWKNRHHLTQLMREVRLMTMQAAKKRGRPLLLAARLPETIAGCRVDGIDIETWTSDRLLDIILDEFRMVMRQTRTTAINQIGPGFVMDGHTIMNRHNRLGFGR